VKKIQHYGKLEMVTFQLDARDIFKLLHRAGEVPEGFGFDFDHNRDFGPDEAIEIRVRNYRQEGAVTIDTETGLPDSAPEERK